MPFLPSLLLVGLLTAAGWAAEDYSDRPGVGDLEAKSANELIALLEEDKVNPYPVATRLAAIHRSTPIARSSEAKVLVMRLAETASDHYGKATFSGIAFLLDPSDDRLFEYLVARASVSLTLPEYLLFDSSGTLIDHRHPEYKLGLFKDRIAARKQELDLWFSKNAAWVGKEYLGAANWFLSLAAVGDSRAKPVFLSGLAAPSVTIRVASVEGLVRLNSLDALPRITESIDALPHAVLRREFVRPLLAFCDPEATRAARRYFDARPSGVDFERLREAVCRRPHRGLSPF